VLSRYWRGTQPAGTTATPALADPPAGARPSSSEDLAGSGPGGARFASPMDRAPAS
jgi:hypothetical protein